MFLEHPGEVYKLKFRDGKWLKPVDVWSEQGRIFIKSGYIPNLIAEIKVMANKKWHGFDKPAPRKLWSVIGNSRNRFQLGYLAHRGDSDNPNPYVRYDAPLIEMPFARQEPDSEGRSPYSHQIETARFFLTRHGCIAAEEMGVGKTLANIMAMEWVKTNDFSKAIHHNVHACDLHDEDRFWYVAPKAVLEAIERELRRWDSHVRPKLMTYEGLTRIMQEWPVGGLAPQVVTFDEASKVKNHTAQRSIAAKGLADGCRRDWGDGLATEQCGHYVWLMTGTPAPRAPDDWWWLCEIACPGFLREGDIYSFRNRLAVIEQKDSIAGGSYPELITWRDSKDKCKVCGQSEDHPNHLGEFKNMTIVDPRDGSVGHQFEPGLNEIELLYKRMQGLVMIKWKKDCLDLPEKRYIIAELKPTPSMLRASKLLLKTATTVIEGLTRCRELADGFQYISTATGREKCPRCDGTKKAVEYQEKANSCPQCKDLNLDDPINQCEQHMPEVEAVEIVCPHCDEFGTVVKYERTESIIDTPKDQELENDLEANIEVGRLVVFAGFTASVDRCVRIAMKKGWATIKLTGKGWEGRNADGSAMLDTDYLSVFQDWKNKPSLTTNMTYPLVCFCADTASGGMGLTLTAACMEIFFSNGFNGGDRTQAEDRGHRPGMDQNRGLTIKDYCVLPQDYLVRENLMKKRRLELMSMGELLAVADRVV